MADVVCILTVKPEIIWLDFLSTFKTLKTYIMVDDNTFDCTELKKKYPTIQFIQIDDNECIKNGYTNMDKIFVKKPVISWDKAVYYFYKNPVHSVWFIENDTFFYNEQTLVDINKKYTTEDLLVGKVIDESHTWVVWSHLTDVKTPKPWYGAMVSATRVSHKLLTAINTYATKYKTLYFLEALFPTECISNKLIYKNIDELLNITIFDSVPNSIHKLYHPIKDLEKHLQIRQNLTNQIGGSFSQPYTEMVNGHNKRKTQRGGASASYGFGAAVSPGAPYASEVIAKEACLAVTRPGTIVNYSAGTGGLPGFAGGSRRVKRNKGRKSKFSLKNLVNSTRKFFFGKAKKQRGGRYTVDVGATTEGPNPIVPVVRIQPEGGLINTAPPGAAPNPAVFQKGGVGGVASPVYYAPTAGYGNTASTWVSSTGTPSLLQTPYEARSLNPACLKTAGGGRRRKQKKSKRKGSKRK